MDGFKGTYYHSLDQKNRLFIPAKFREKLGEEFVVVKSPKPEKCLFVYTKHDWEMVEYALNNLKSGPAARAQARMVYAALDELSADKQGRITLKEEFCTHACFEKDVMVLGSGKRIELWDKNEWDKMNEEIMNDESIVFEELPW